MIRGSTEQHETSTASSLAIRWNHTSQKVKAMSTSPARRKRRAQAAQRPKPAQQRRSRLEQRFRSIKSNPHPDTEYPSIAAMKRQLNREGRNDGFKWLLEIAFEARSVVVLEAVDEIDRLELDRKDWKQKLARRPEGETYDGIGKRTNLTRMNDLVWQGKSPREAAEIIVASMGIGSFGQTTKEYETLLGKIEPTASLKAQGLSWRERQEAIRLLRTKRGDDVLVVPKIRAIQNEIDALGVAEGWSEAKIVFEFVARTKDLMPELPE